MVPDWVKSQKIHFKNYFLANFVSKYFLHQLQLTFSLGGPSWPYHGAQRAPIRAHRAQSPLQGLEGGAQSTLNF